MKIKIVSPTFLKGKALKAGDVVEADDIDQHNLLASGRAIKAPAAAKKKEAAK